MIISTNWLSDYVSLSASTEALVERLLLSGLNHESTWTVGADTAIKTGAPKGRALFFAYFAAMEGLQVGEREEVGVGAWAFFSLACAPTPPRPPSRSCSNTPCSATATPA